MQRGSAGSHSIAMDTSILHSVGYADSIVKQAQHELMRGFPLPLSLGEAMNSYLGGQTTTLADSSQFWNTEPTGGVIPLPSTFAYPITDNSTDILNSSFVTTNNAYEEAVPFGATNRWDFNNLMPPVVEGQSYANHDWMATEQREGSYSKLSLSLTTLQPTAQSIQEQCSEMSSSGGITSYSLHKMQSEHASSSSSTLSDSQKPPQVSWLLSGSRFFHAMQEILAEIACYALESYDGTSCHSSAIGVEGDKQIMLKNGSSQGDVEVKKKHLLNLLQVVDERYNQCLDEIHTVVSAFHAVTELDPNLHSRFALPAISCMYRKLRERISNHILSLGACSDHSVGSDSGDEMRFVQKQWALQQLRKRDHQLWRPQRGLPERSVSVLRTWMFKNFLHPYPKDAEKHLLAVESGLTRSQVSNWFINARVRLWKPMIEEMDAEISRSTKAGGNDKDDLEGRRRFTMN